MTSYDDDPAVNAGASTDQQISGFEEEGTFVTDDEPTLSPSHGSSNAGVNKLKANREDFDPDHLSGGAG